MSPPHPVPIAGFSKNTLAFRIVPFLVTVYGATTLKRTKSSLPYAVTLSLRTVPHLVTSGTPVAFVVPAKN